MIHKNNTLIIWDELDDNQQQLMLELFGLENARLAFNSENLDNIDFSQIEIEYIILLAELKWEDKTRSSLYGLELIKQLRIKRKILQPIIVSSALSYNQLTEKPVASQAENILITPGHYYLSLEGDIDIQLAELLKKIKPISSTTLDDIIDSIYDAAGSLHNILHNLRDKLRRKVLKKNLDIVITEYKSFLPDYFNKIKQLIERKHQSEFLKLQQLAIKELIQSVETEINEKLSDVDVTDDYNETLITCSDDIIDKITPKLLSFIPISNLSNLTNRNSKEWEVLYIDDNLELHELVRHYFTKYGVLCHCVTNEKDAVDKFRQEEHISFILTDIRLLDEKGKWQDSQGYDILENIHQYSQRPLVYAYLSNKRATMQRFSGKKKGFEILHYTKSNVINTQSAFNVFFDTIETYVDSVHEVKRFRPSRKAWVNGNIKNDLPYSIYYKKHLESIPEEWEKRINNKVKLYIQNEIIPLKPTTKLKGTSINEKNLDDFRERVLFLRRLILAKVFLDESAAQICESIMGEGKKSEDHFKTIFNTTLALPTDPSILREQCCSFYLGNTEILELTKEEFLFIEEEFLNEMYTDKDGLQEDRAPFKNIIKQIETDYLEFDIKIPFLLKKIKVLLNESDGFPSVGTISILLNEALIVYQDKTDRGSGFKYNLIDKFSNPVLKNLFKDFFSKI